MGYPDPLTIRVRVNAVLTRLGAGPSSSLDAAVLEEPKAKAKAKGKAKAKAKAKERKRKRKGDADDTEDLLGPASLDSLVDSGLSFLCKK